MGAKSLRKLLLLQWTPVNSVDSQWFAERNTVHWNRKSSLEMWNKAFFLLKHKSETISATIWLARGRDGGEGWGGGGGVGSIWKSCFQMLLIYLFLLTSLQSVARFSLQPLFSGLGISTYLIEADLNILLFNVPGALFSKDPVTYRAR